MAGVEHPPSPQVMTTPSVPRHHPVSPGEETESHWPDGQDVGLGLLPFFVGKVGWAT